MSAQVVRRLSASLRGAVAVASALCLGGVLALPVRAQDAPADASVNAQQPASNANAPAGQARAAPDKFMINAFDVEGVAQLDQGTVEDAVYPFTGPDRTSLDVEAARKALQQAYAKRGFEAVQVDVPAQPEETFSQGIVKIAVSEVPIGSVTVSGSKYHSLAVIRQQLPSVAEGKALNLKSLESDLSGANRFPDRSINPSFVAGKVPGTVDVDLEVTDSLPVHGSLELTNDHSPSTVPLRLTANLSYANLWQLGHTVSATYIVAPQDRHQSEVFSGSYTIPFLGSPWTLVLYGYSSNSNINSLGGTTVLGDGYQVGTRVIYRLPNQKIVQNVTLGADFKHFNQDIALGDQLASSSPIEYVPLYASYGLSYGSNKTNLDLTLSVTAGLRTFKKLGCFKVDGTACTPAELQDQFKNKDFDSNENFVHGNLDLTFKHSLPGQFAGTLKLTGQVADSHLVTNEQYAIGGLQTVRGYLQSEAVGDAGYGLSVEIATPSIASKLTDFVDELRFFTFVDNGQIRILHALPDVRRSRALLSVGGGIRFQMFKHLYGDLAVGVPLFNGSDTQRNSIVTTFDMKGQF